MSKKYLLINPNSSTKTSQLMLNIVNTVRSSDMHFDVMTASYAPSMITNEEELCYSEKEVINIAQTYQHHYAGIIVGAFGDPGLLQLKSILDIPVTGLCEASIIEASHNKRTFSISTVTPNLIDMMNKKVDDLGLSSQYKGVFCTQEDPLSLTQDAEYLYQQLLIQTNHAIAAGSDVVIIGGGPLGEVAHRMKIELNYPVIAPLTSAVNHLYQLRQSIQA